MAQETLAQPWAYDAGSWKKGDGTNKGMWVYDASSWKPVSELYAYDGGSWHIVHPVHAVSCVIAPSSDGTCDAVDASYRIQSTWYGPMPQSTSGLGDRYKVEHWDRISTTAIGIFSATWILRGTVNLTVTLINPLPISYGYVIGGATTRRWHQAQCRLLHTIHGYVDSISGGIKSSNVRTYYIDDCDG